MVFPNATELAAAGGVIESAYNAFPFMATIFGVVAIYKLAPMGIKLFRRALGGG